MVQFFKLKRPLTYTDNSTEKFAPVKMCEYFKALRLPAENEKDG
ncbi:MAG: hypothetical protein ACOX4M_09365 [Acetivibrionales bacterium]